MTITQLDITIHGKIKVVVDLEVYKLLGHMYPVEYDPASYPKDYSVLKSYTFNSNDNSK